MLWQVTKVFAQAPQHIQMWNEVLMNSAADSHSGDEYGFSVSIHDDFAVVGAPSHDFDVGATANSNTQSVDYKEDAGAVYLYSKFGAYWRNPVKLAAPDRQEFDLFGYSVSTSGSWCAVGAPGEDHNSSGTSASTTSQAGYLAGAGSVYLFYYNGTSWVFHSKITAPVRGASDQFGTKVHLDGSHLWVSSPYEDEDASEANTLINSGSVYLYLLQNSTWGFSQKIVAGDRAAGDEFGSAIDFDGTTLAVGARFSDGVSSLNRGSAYLFSLSGSWTEQAKITASDGGANDNFGTAVSIYSSNLAVGSPGNLGRGAAYVYRLQNGSWGTEQKLTATDIQSQDLFGAALSVYKDTLIVGAPGEDHDATGTSSSTTAQGYLANAGSAYIFYRVSSGWSQSQKVIASSRSSQSNFASSVDLFKEDAWLGTPYHDANSSISGALTSLGKDIYVWVGHTSSDPGTASNWKEGTLPPTDHNFLFTKGQHDPVFTSSLYANHVTVLPQVDVAIQAPNVVRADGSIYNDGSITLLGSNTGTYSSLFFRGAYLGIGTVSKEQFLSSGWHQVSSPFTNHWSSITGGNASALVPFNETTGNYGSPGTNLTDEGRGFFAQVSSTPGFGSSTFLTSASLFTLQGVPRTQVTFNLGYSNNLNPTNVQHTSAVTDGWNLIGNPFTSPIDFRYLVRNDVDPYYSIWDPSLNGGLGGHKYFSFVGGSLSYVIPPMQAFWVRAWSNTSSISSATMGQVGTIVQVPRYLKSGMADVQLTVYNELDSSFTDAIYLTYVQGAQNNLATLGTDVPKRMAPLGSVNMYLANLGFDVAAKGVDLTEDTLKYEVVIQRPSGSWRVHAEGKGFGTHQWYLVPKNGGQATLLPHGVALPLVGSDTIFELLAVRTALNVRDSPNTMWSCISTAFQEITFSSCGSIPYQIILYNTSGQLVWQHDNIVENEIVRLQNSGMYIIQVKRKETQDWETLKVVVP